MEECHGGVRKMMRQESFNFGVVRGITNTAFMPARQRESTCRYDAVYTSPHGGHQKFQWEGGPREGNFQGGWGQILKVFFPGTLNETRIIVFIDDHTFNIAGLYFLAFLSGACHLVSRCVAQQLDSNNSVDLPRGPSVVAYTCIYFRIIPETTMKVTNDTVTISELPFWVGGRRNTVQLKDADPNELQLFIEKLPASIKGYIFTIRFFFSLQFSFIFYIVTSPVRLSAPSRVTTCLTLENNNQKSNKQAMLNLREANSTSRTSELERQLRDFQQREENFQRQLRDTQQREENLQRQFRDLQEREQSAQRQLTESQQREQNLQRQLRELQEQEQNSQRQLTESQQREQNSQRQLRNCQEQVSELQLSLSTAQLTINEFRSQETRDWVITRDEIQITDKCLGRGGWGSVNEGTYCGCTVAVKQIHELILSPHNINLFEREMNIAAKCRHPHLLQFIGATKDEGTPLFVTELMEKSLRTLLDQRQLSETEIRTISLDVARSLNYLHQKKPEPIIHRDVSSANVLLWRQGEEWRGKVSDYGTANFIQQTMTVAPGAMIYSAPEALTSKQTVKVSFH
ncbi:unnamed protein product [Porites lobata]|uniref:Protein kinase domain-containing protein n=1 Tax=Porites lobata TaxID=104759 RepID=A0ABN8RST0_9CNID|nr:unnamed protein product [Porites lobata]